MEGGPRAPTETSSKNQCPTPMFSPTLRLSNKRLTQPAARAEPGMAPPHCRDCRRGRGSPFLATLAAASCTARASAKVTRLARESIATAWTKCASAAPAPHTLRLATHVENELVVSRPSDPSRSRAGRPAEHWACTQECSARQLIREDEEVGASRD